LIFAYIGYSGPTFWLRKIVNKRIKTDSQVDGGCRRLIVLAIEAGWDSTRRWSGRAKTKGPLSEELGAFWTKCALANRRVRLFAIWRNAVRMSELTLLVAAIDQATRMGTGLRPRTRLQATEIRERRMAFIREQAGKLPVKMMLPLVFCIFPALFVVILGQQAS
jgi:tight adherence protein C